MASVVGQERRLARRVVDGQHVQCDKATDDSRVPQDHLDAHTAALWDARTAIVNTPARDGSSIQERGGGTRTMLCPTMSMGRGDDCARTAATMSSAMAAKVMGAGRPSASVCGLAPWWRRSTATTGRPVRVSTASAQARGQPGPEP